MTPEEILGKLKEIVHTIKPKLDLSNVTLESSLVKDLGIDSLSMLLLSLATENEFGLQFEPDVKFNTIGEVVDYIARK
ncbi:MAG: phosphopantetheine-binding protein [Bacteroidales bacterium]|nr:phosphopantetheine-binding protein [Bacteroidales bacterium]